MYVKEKRKRKEIYQNISMDRGQYSKYRMILFHSKSIIVQTGNTITKDEI